MLDGAFVEDNGVSPSGGRADFDRLWGGDEDIKQPVREQFLGSYRLISKNKRYTSPLKYEDDDEI